MIEVVAKPGRPRGRRYDRAQISARYRERAKARGVVELRGMRVSKSELVFLDELAELLGYGTRNEMLIVELIKLGAVHGLSPRLQRPSEDQKRPTSD